MPVEWKREMILLEQIVHQNGRRTVQVRWEVEKQGRTGDGLTRLTDDLRTTGLVLFLLLAFAFVAKISAHTPASA